MENFFLYLLLGGGALSVGYVVIGNVVSGVLDALDHPILNVPVLLAFATVMGGAGFSLERLTDWTLPTLLWNSGGIALIVVYLLHLFVLAPLRMAEATWGLTTEELIGLLAEVIVPIPENGFGEILIRLPSGNIAKAARSQKNTLISTGTRVMVVEMEDAFAIVTPYSYALPHPDTKR